MDTQQKRQWGVTQPISEAQPTEADLKLNDLLVEALKAENNFETPEGTDNRMKVLQHLQNVVEEFVRRAGKAKNLPQSTVDNGGGKIFTFGSYALGVYGPTSDIDTLVVAPKHVYIHDFFNIFPEVFKEMSDAKDITEFNPVPEAYVPIIKMEYRGVPIDLIFVSLPSLSSIPSSWKDISDKSLLRGLDDTSMRSVNGTRVTAEMVSLVPQVKSFRHALRAVKLWSNRRAIYGAVFGFPGGVAWAIMVARICQLYPFACGATILAKFFNLMLKWHWPRPVMLKHIEEGSLNLRVWNPQIYPQDKAHLMPVITPAFPAMCSTHTIMHSTKGVLLEEFQRADNLVNQIHAGRKSWMDLFDGHTFFTKDHKYYLSVVAASRNKEAHGTFSGLVQSKVRLLVKGIEDGDAGVDRARAFTKGFERVHRCRNEDEIDRVVQGNLEYQVKDQLENGASNGDGGDYHTIYTTTFYIGLTLPEGKASTSPRSLDISFPVSEFKRYVTMATEYDEVQMSVRVVHTRNYQLPDDVFQAGEEKPAKPVKEKKKKAKRSFAETGLDVRNTHTCKK
ncbi:Poly(A) polymerase [Sporormia fimetaria CBS 119925]|uniref:Poly(A) polymerase n=1 Tax=Sporormia fimetaria CBS 119925 TaxID=1340428 RepID=A0A6A6VJU4_9PLEO|nr:Poly(A) polymerase [Sporormia fimetaria CBS 119925]